MACKIHKNKLKLRRLKKYEIGGPVLGNQSDSFYDTVNTTNFANTNGGYTSVGASVSPYTEKSSNINMDTVNNTAYTTSGVANTVSGIYNSYVKPGDYTDQYGYQKSMLTDSTSLLGPVGSAIGSVAGLGEDIASSYINYDQYGVASNKNQEQIYDVASAVFDPSSQMQKDIDNNEWGSFVADLSGVGAILNAYKTSKQDQKDAQINKQKGEFQQYQNYYNKNILPQYMAKGGTINKFRSSNPNAELERGETLRTPDGEIYSIPTTAPSHAQGGVQMNLPQGTEILGKKMNNDKEFKELGRELVSMQKKHKNIVSGNSTPVDKATSKRMLSNIQRKYSEYMQKQAEGNPMGMYSTGGIVDPWFNLSDQGKIDDTNIYRSVGTRNVNYHPITKKNVRDISKDAGIPYNNKMSVDEFNRGVESIYGEGYLPIKGELNKKGFNRYYKDIGTQGETTNYNRAGYEIGTNKTGRNYNYINQDKSQNMYAKGGRIPKYAWPNEQNYYDMTTKGIQSPELNIYNNEPLKTMQDYTYDTYGSNRNLTRNLNNIPKEYSGTYGGQQPGPQVEQSWLQGAYDDTKGWLSNNSGDILSGIGTYAPVAYNLYKGIFDKPEKMNPSDYYNSRAGEALGVLKNREYNIDPQLQANRDAQLNYQNALKRGAPSKAQMLSNLRGGSAQRMRADAEAIQYKQNVDNQYKGDYASALMNVGVSEAQIKLTIKSYNDMAKAQKDKYLQQGLQDLSEVSQMQKLIKGQTTNDRIKLIALNDYFANFGINQSTIDAINKGDMRALQEAKSIIELKTKGQTG